MSVEDLTITELQAEWRAAFGQDPPRRASREFLAGNLAWCQQSRAVGGMPKKLHRQLMKLARASAENPDYRPPRARPKLKTGTRLVREWKGKVYEVTVTAAGFEYEGSTYPNLSPIAR